MTTHAATSEPAIRHTIGPDGRLAIQLASWDVELRAAAGDEARAWAVSGELPSDLEIIRGPASLTIRQPSRIGFGILLGSGRTDVRLAVEVPSGTEVDVQTASGDVVATGFTRRLHLRTASGEIRAAGAAGDVAIEAVSGDIDVALAGATRLTVRSVSGDVAVDGGVVERLGVTTTSGDLRLLSELGPGPHAIATLSGDALVTADAGIRVIARTVAGDLRTSLPHTSEGGPGRRSFVVGDGAIEVQFKSVSGDLRVVDRAGAGSAPRPSGPRPPAPLGPPAPPHPPAPPYPADPPVAPMPLPPAAEEAPTGPDTVRLEILRALERGDIDVAEAGDRLAALDEPSDD